MVTTSLPSSLRRSMQRLTGAEGKRFRAPSSTATYNIINGHAPGDGLAELFRRPSLECFGGLRSEPPASSSPVRGIHHAPTSLELTLEEMLADPIIQLVISRDNAVADDVRRGIYDAREAHRGRDLPAERRRASPNRPGDDIMGTTSPELTLEEMLADPIVQLVMRRDNIVADDVRWIIHEARQAHRIENCY